MNGPQFVLALLTCFGAGTCFACVLVRPTRDTPDAYELEGGPVIARRPRGRRHLVCLEGGRPFDWARDCPELNGVSDGKIGASR